MLSIRGILDQLHCGRAATRIIGLACCQCRGVSRPARCHSIPAGKDVPEWAAGRGRWRRIDCAVALRGLPRRTAPHANSLDVKVLDLALRARPGRLVPVIAGILQNEEVPAIRRFVWRQAGWQGCANYKDIVDVRAPLHTRPVAGNEHTEGMILGWVVPDGQSRRPEAYPHQR